jgi:uncharacterized protein YqgQ
MTTLDEVKTQVDNLNYLNFDSSKIKAFVETIKEDDLNLSNLGFFKYTWNLKESILIIFYLNSMNFCYWAEKEQTKWRIKIGDKEFDGFIALLRAFEEEFIKNKNLLEPTNIINLTFEKFGEILKGNIKIPLFEERFQNLITTASVLIEKYDSNFENLLSKTNNSAPELLNEIVSHFPSFQDKSIYSSSTIHFYKRAQLQVKMIHDQLIDHNQSGLEKMDYLTAFADYKVPQILRHLGIINYSDELANKVDNYELIEKDSNEENEIRIATIWAIELIKHQLILKYPQINSSDIDSILWKNSQNIKGEIKPYHRTYTLAY